MVGRILSVLFLVFGGFFVVVVDVLSVFAEQISKTSANVNLCVFQFLKLFTCDQFSEALGWQKPTGFKYNYISCVTLLEAEKD